MPRSALQVKGEGIPGVVIFIQVAHNKKGGDDGASLCQHFESELSVIEAFLAQGDRSPRKTTPPYIDRSCDCFADY